MFDFGECDKGSNITAEIMEVELQRRYMDDYDLPWVPDSKIHVGQIINKRRTQEIIYFEDHISSSTRILCKALYRDKYADELNTYLIDNSVGFNQS